MTIIAMRAKRAKAIEAAKAFLESHRDANGFLSTEDDAIYTGMENDIGKMGVEIARMERMEAMDAELAKPVSAPITEKPATAKGDTKTGTASDSYKDAFWNATRARNGISYEVRNALQQGVDSEGGYICPEVFVKELVKALTARNVVRSLSHSFNTSAPLSKIPVVASRGTASWIEEEGPIPEGDDVFGQQYIGAHKVGTLIKVSEELLSDSAFDLENYFVEEFSRRIGNKEEEAFLSGDGVNKPTGLLNDAEIGVTAASATAITADELIDLFYSLDAPYRKNAVWLVNDSTMRAIRKLKDSNGQYLWQKALHEGEHETLLGKPIFHSPFAPEIEAGAKAVAFGDFSYYWIGDREGITFRRLNERYAETGQVGFLATKRTDGKLILPEAIKVLQMKGTATA
jgi:HK97 family phage major capsid protein